MDWKKTLASLAPGIATSLGGPMAGMAVKLAADALGIEPTENALMAAVTSGNPDVFAQLKEAETNLKVELKRLDISLEEIHGKDRSSARLLALKSGIWPQVILSMIFIGGFVMVLKMIFLGSGIDDTMHDASLILVGVLCAEVTRIMTFWFGSSSGSKEKTRLLR